MSERIRSMQIDVDKALEMEAEIERLGAINVILEVKIRELEGEVAKLRALLLSFDLTDMGTYYDLTPHEAGERLEAAQNDAARAEVKP